VGPQAEESSDGKYQVFQHGTPDIECDEHSQRNGKRDLPSVLHGPDEMTKCLECNARALDRIRAAMTRTAKQYAWRALKRKYLTGHNDPSDIPIRPQSH
jgi:hypothetical protein